MASKGNAPITESPRKRGRWPRKVIFEEPHESETPNHTENTMPQPLPRIPVLPVQNEPPQAPATEQLLALLRQALTQGQQSGNHNHEPKNNAEDKQLARFLKFNPPKFKGEPDDQKAEFWLMEVEKVFKVLEYSDSQKVKYATFLFEKAACQWWRVAERRWEREEMNLI